MWAKSRPKLHFSLQCTSTTFSVKKKKTGSVCSVSRTRRSKWLFQISAVVLHWNIYLIIHLLTLFLKGLAKLQWFFSLFRMVCTLSFPNFLTSFECQALPFPLTALCTAFFLPCKSSHLFEIIIFSPFCFTKEKRKKRCVSRETKGLFHRLGLNRSRPDIVKKYNVACLSATSLPKSHWI